MANTHPHILPPAKALCVQVQQLLKEQGCVDVRFWEEMARCYSKVFIARFVVRGQSFLSPEVRYDEFEDLPTAEALAAKLTPPRDPGHSAPLPVAPAKTGLEMFTRYGMMFECDCDVIDAVLAELLTRSPGKTLKIVEIGPYEGHTGRGMKKFIEEHGGKIEYWGIEPGKLKPIVEAFPGAHMINERSDWAFHLVPDDLDMVFVDGDHSRNYVILDTMNFYRKIVPGGFMLFHDTNPRIQMQGYEYDGPPKIPEFGIAVRAAWDLMHWPWAPWELWMERIPANHHQNGLTAFRNGR